MTVSSHDSRAERILEALRGDKEVKHGLLAVSIYQAFLIALEHTPVRVYKYDLPG